MIKFLYSIRDSKTSFGVPFCEQSDAAAQRGFSFAFHNQQSLVGFSPADFSLYRIGTFDDVSAKLVSIIPELIFSASDFLNMKGDVPIEMQKVFDAMPNDMGIKAEMVLEINEKHAIADKLKSLYETDKEAFSKYTKILYAEARMIAGLPIDNPTEISTLICDVISK